WRRRSRRAGRRWGGRGEWVRFVGMLERFPGDMGLAPDRRQRAAVLGAVKGEPPSGVVLSRHP
ncbi:MAG: hypothetical protein WAN86_05065, partial [Hyphomicrobiaceae bacterium]